MGDSRILMIPLAVNSHALWTNLLWTRDSEPSLGEVFGKDVGSIDAFNLYTPSRGPQLVNQAPVKVPVAKRNCLPKLCN